VGSAPVLEGFEYLDLLGSGGFADVFLFEQAMPKRRVAVKVLRDVGLTDRDRETFTSEVNLMAALSSHPHIVTIYGADVSEDGRPFLVMEYYSGPNLSVRCRQRPLGVAEALRIGVQIAGAVETAHRAGILHRDLKPANILTSAFGKPGLTDFGISAVKADSSVDAGGLSVPWSPPELLDDQGLADERSDVYSLAATIHTLLVGRSPFESSGSDNSAMEVMARIERAPVPSVGRSDAPASLDRALAAAMAKSPDSRPGSAAAFARSLQAIEREMRLQPTELDVIDEDEHPAAGPGPEASGGGWEPDQDGTRLRAPRIIAAQPVVTSIPTTTAPTAPGAAVPPVASAPTPAATAPAAGGHTVRRHAAPLDDGTALRPTTIDPSQATPSPPRVAGARRVREPEKESTKGRWIVLGVAAAAAAALVGVVLVGGSSSQPAATPTSEPGTADLNAPELAPVPSASVARDGTTITVTWDAALDQQDGDDYLVRYLKESQVVDVPGVPLQVSFTDVPESEGACVLIVHRRDTQQSLPLKPCEQP
jgi:tRNA A-37 threonylcarbamoyl transferase component Bud32